MQIIDSLDGPQIGETSGVGWSGIWFLFSVALLLLFTSSACQHHPQVSIHVFRRWLVVAVGLRAVLFLYREDEPSHPSKAEHSPKPHCNWTIFWTTHHCDWGLKVLRSVHLWRPIPRCGSGVKPNSVVVIKWGRWNEGWRITTTSTIKV